MNKRIINNFEKYKERIFLFDATSDKIYTYGDIFERSAGLANLLYGKNNYKNSKIAIILNNSFEFIVYYFATMFLGATVVPLNPNYSSKELSFVINKIEPDIILSTDDIFEEKIENKAINFLSMNKIGLNELKAKRFDFDIPEIQWDDLAAILFTSGTTGKPKGVGMKYGAVFENLSIYGSDMQFNQKSRFMQIVPLFHAHGWLYSSVVPALFGSSVIMNEPFNVRLCAKFWDIVKKYNGSVLVAVPSVLMALMEMSKRYKEVPKGLIDYVICGSSFLHINLKNTFEEKFDTTIYEWYGSTETIYLAYHSPDVDYKSNTVGRIFPKNVEIKIKESSEVCVKTDYFFEGYINEPELTKETFDEEGWYHTGDTGGIDNDGYIFLTGRIKNIINKGGYKVSPAQIDNCLLEYNGIIDAATIGVPDEMYGEEIYSFVAVNERKVYDEEDIANHCKANLSKNIIPKRIISIPSIPRNAMGKTDKFKLAEMYKEIRG